MLLRRRPLASLLLAIPAVWLFWVVAAQVFLWTPLLRSLINTASPSVHVEYSFAWSLWPGTVHLRGLLITGEDRKVQWRLGIDRASADIAVGQLLSRTFHARRVRADGVQFALRQRLAWDAPLPAGLPMIEGLPARPTKEEGPDDDIPDFRYKLFTVWLEDVDASRVRQVWIDRLRLEDAEHVAGGFYLKPVRELRLEPSALQMRSARVFTASEPLATAVDGTLRVRIAPYDPRATRGLAILRQVDLDLDGSGRAAGFAQGELKSAMHVQAGQVLPGSALSAKLIDVVAAQFAAAGLSIDFHASPPDGAQLTADVRELRAQTNRAARVHIDAVGEPPDFADPRLPRSVRVSLNGAVVREDGETIVGDARIDARVAPFEQGADLAGTTVAIDDARVLRQDAAPGWWGRFVFEKARLTYGGDLDASITARCRDARPLVGLYANRADLPGFVKSMFSMEGLSLRIDAAAGKRWVALRDLSADGEGATVRATLLQRGKQKKGALELWVHGIPIAIDLAGGGVQLVTPGDFFTERKAEVARSIPRARRPRPQRRKVAPVQAAR